LIAQIQRDSRRLELVHERPDGRVMATQPGEVDSDEHVELTSSGTVEHPFHLRPIPSDVVDDVEDGVSLLLGMPET